MLVGPPIRPILPRLPTAAEGSDGILRYLQDLERSVNVFFSAVAGQTVGMLGVQGLSSSGTVARNFTARLSISNATSAVWSLMRPEPDASYLLLSSPSRSTGMVMTVRTLTTTGVEFTFSPAVPSGMLLDLVLFR